MWYNPIFICNDIKNFCVQLSCDWVGAINVDCGYIYEYDNCHNNVSRHVDLYGGYPVIGWYIISGVETLQAIRHTIWGYNGELSDITSYKDNREYIIFGRSKDQKPTYTIPNCYYSL